MDLGDFFTRHPKAALGLSGGADSAYLLYAGLSLGADLRPYFVSSAFQPEFELEDARRLCGELGAELSVISLDVLAEPLVAANPADRCYHCKRLIFSALRDRALADGYGLLLDGTNASDQVDDRPGMRALEELRVLSPLRLCGITKAELRRRSREAGLFTWDKPAYACLATRVPTGEEISPGKLRRIDGAETELFRMGFTDLRVRLDGSAARLQFNRSQLPAAAETEFKSASLMGLSRYATAPSCTASFAYENS